MRWSLIFAVLFAAGCASHFEDRPFATTLPEDNGWIAAVATIADTEALWFVADNSTLTEAQIGGNQLTSSSPDGALSWAPTVSVAGALGTGGSRREEVLLISVPAGDYALAGARIKPQRGGGKTVNIGYVSPKVEFQVESGTVTFLGNLGVSGLYVTDVGLSWSEGQASAVATYIDGNGAKAGPITQAFSDDPFTGADPLRSSNPRPTPRFIYMP
ncbi:MAG: hypothetical protein AAF830_02945 [Pseudomonadota bacterium]